MPIVVFYHLNSTVQTLRSSTVFHKIFDVAKITPHLVGTNMKIALITGHSKVQQTIDARGNSNGNCRRELCPRRGRGRACYEGQNFRDWNFEI